MKNYFRLFSGFVMVVCYTSCGPQNRTELATNELKPESKYFINSDSPSSIVRNIEQDRNGRIWIASWEGVFLSDGSSFTNFTTTVSSARFFSVLEDSKGNMWFGSIGSGVFYYDGKRFKNYKTEDGLLNNDVVSIYEDKAGNIWFGVFGGASRYDGKSFQNFIINENEMNEDPTGKTFSERPEFEVNSIIEDKTGKFWFATRGNTFVFDGKDFNSVSHLGKPFTNVRSVIEDQKGNIWLGGNDGLWRYDGSTFTNIAKGFVGFIYEDKNGNILTSSETSEGWALSRYNEKSLSNRIAVVPEIIKANEGMIFGIREANDGSIWFGTLDGVKRFDGKTVNGFNAMSSQEYFSRLVAARDNC
ncbi:ligand-binding sensor domain-containing protein [Aquiflexum gelatinilyticum]|uniref:ligand-binding sensor domain-containing protein n=1 Tax=Aquiflexum gelatinilyticum TaxID=2961943 RepID=UPI002167FFF6|nr:two-component regulator propeller domain-containing protein [Aquiflexum gelatinilyticum]MCS4435145.1 histidine kinase [Aquiflexum gelatinilyticum]